MDKRITTIHPVLKDSLYRKIADAIIDYIRVNRLGKGDKLPSERALAEQFSTSRNSLREALRVLENQGMIEVRTGKGTFVVSDSPESIVNVKLWQVNYRELLEIKYLLERSIVEQLCYREEAIDLQQLEAPLCQLENAAKDGIYLQKADHEFHSRLRHMTTNSALEQLIDSLIKTLDSYGEVLKGVDNIWISTIPFHRLIFEGIREKDFMKAGEACRSIYEMDLHALQLKEEYNL